LSQGIHGGRQLLGEREDRRAERTESERKSLTIVVVADPQQKEYCGAYEMREGRAAFAAQPLSETGKRRKTFHQGGKERW